MPLSAWLIFVGAVLVAVGGLMSAKELNRSTTDIESLGAENKELGQTNVKLGGENKELGQTNNKLGKENKELSETNQSLLGKLSELATTSNELAVINSELTTKNTELTVKVIDSIEGGDTYPLIAFRHFESYADATRGFSLIQGEVLAMGDNPIECLGGRQQNATEYTAELAKREGKTSMSGAEVAVLMSAGSMPDIPPSRIIPDNADDFNRRGTIIPGVTPIKHHETEVEFGSEINCRNGEFLQKTKMKKIAVIDSPNFPRGMWHVDSVVVKEKNGTIDGQQQYIIRLDSTKKVDDTE